MVTLHRGDYMGAKDMSAYANLVSELCGTCCEIEMIQQADDEAPSRTQTRSKRHAQQREELPDDTKLVEAPNAAHMELIDGQHTDHMPEDHTKLHMADVPDSTNFYEEVNDDPELAWGWVGGGLGCR